jgi:predicted Zn-dependent peptidase
MPRRKSTPKPTTHRLSNGLRVVTTRIPGEAVSIALAVRAGSVYDPPRSAGIAHFLEHLLFKATRDYTRAEVATAMQRCGNRFDPATSKELVSISGTVPAAKTGEALALLSSVTRHPLFDSRDVETERQVVLEELRDWQDDPSRRIELLTDAAMWGTHPMGRDIAGTRASVAGISRAQVQRHHRRYFHPRNAVLSMAGALEEDEMLEAARSHFGGWRGGADALVPKRTSAGVREPVLSLGRRSKVLRRSNSQQVWFSISTTTPSYSDGYEAVLRTQLAQTLIGDGDGSRLWDGLREKLGLAYDVYATQDFYARVGVMSAMAAVSRGRAGLGVREMKRILEETHHGFSLEEFERGRDSLSAQITLTSDSSSAQAARYAELALFEQPLITPAHELGMLRSFRVCDFNDFVKEKIRWDSGVACAIGEGPALAAVRAK